MKRVALVLVAAVVLTLVLGVVALAAPAGEPAAAAPPERGIGAGLLGLAAAVAVAFGALGTAWAQSRIGSAAAGAMAERPELRGTMLIFLALPETIIILGFLVAFFILGKI